MLDLSAVQPVRAELVEAQAQGPVLKPFFVYLLRCADGSFYVGHTDELERRMAQHHLGEIKGYTQVRRPVELLWSQETASREEALAAELRLKGWSRAKKLALIQGDWNRIKQLARAKGFDKLSPNGGVGHA